MATKQNQNPFDRSHAGYFSERLVTDREIEVYLGWAEGTASVKRCRGTWPFPTVKAGRNNRCPVGEVFKVLGM